MNKKYETRKNAAEKLGIHYHTLYRLAERKEIETIQVGNRQLYNVTRYIKENNTELNNKCICYCRVSSNKQKGDLKRQIIEMKKEYPDYEIISDIGSGLNFKRKGLRKILDMAVRGEIEEVVITYKDRLARIGYELIEYLIEEYSGGKITITNKGEEETPDEEMTKDVLSIMNIYVAKINGMRSGKNRKNNKK
jgi:excisionase family DNA binding protein